MGRYANTHKESAIRGRVTSHRNSVDLLRPPKPGVHYSPNGLTPAQLAEVPQLSDRTLAIINIELTSHFRLPIRSETMAEIEAEMSNCVAVLRDVKRRKCKAVCCEDEE